MKNYLKLFTELRESLEKNPMIDLDHFEIGKGLHMANINMIEKEYKVVIPETLKVLYQDVCSVDFLWTLKSDADIVLLDQDEPGNVNGKAFIPDLDTVFDGGSSDSQKEPWEDIFWFRNTMEKDILEENMKVRPIDFYNQNTGECICLLKEKSKSVRDTLYLRDEEAAVMLFGLDLYRYLNLVVKVSGFLNFQLAYIAKNGYENLKLKYYAPKIFPGIDLSEFD